MGATSARRFPNATSRFSSRRSTHGAEPAQREDAARGATRRRPTRPTPSRRDARIPSERGTPHTGGRRELLDTTELDFEAQGDECCAGVRSSAAPAQAAKEPTRHALRTVDPEAARQPGDRAWHSQCTVGASGPPCAVALCSGNELDASFGPAGSAGERATHRCLDPPLAAPPYSSAVHLQASFPQWPLHGDLALHAVPTTAARRTRRSTTRSKSATRQQRLQLPEGTRRAGTDRRSSGASGTWRSSPAGRSCRCSCAAHATLGPEACAASRCKCGWGSP